MKDLSTVDRMHVQAADCWVSVGDVDHATAELGQIFPASRDHPDVLQVRWYIAAKAREWETCAELATTLMQTTPERLFGWVYLSSSLRRLNQWEEAIRVLRDAIKQFGNTPTLLLSLACCHARLGSLARATKFLKQAFELAEDQHARHRLLFRAFNEPDLEKVWQSNQGSLGGIV